MARHAAVSPTLAHGRERRESPVEMPPGVNHSSMTAVAVDCEMVGIVPRRTREGGGETSAIAQVCAVDYEGHTLLLTYVQPSSTVNDFRTSVSGVRREHLVGAPPLSEVYATVRELLHGGVTRKRG